MRGGGYKSASALNTSSTASITYIDSRMTITMTKRIVATILIGMINNESLFYDCIRQLRPSKLNTISQLGGLKVSRSAGVLQSVGSSSASRNWLRLMVSAYCART